MAIWTQTYYLSPDEFASRAQELLNDGVSIYGLSGVIRHSLPFGNSMELSYSYDGQSDLSVELVACSAFESSVEKKINKWFSTTGENYEK